MGTRWYRLISSRITSDGTVVADGPSLAAFPEVLPSPLAHLGMAASGKKGKLRKRWYFEWFGKTKSNVFFLFSRKLCGIFFQFSINKWKIFTPGAPGNPTGGPGNGLGAMAIGIPGGPPIIGWPTGGTWGIPIVVRGTAPCIWKNIGIEAVFWGGVFNFFCYSTKIDRFYRKLTRLVANALAVWSTSFWAWSSIHFCKKIFEIERNYKINEPDRTSWRYPCAFVLRCAFSGPTASRASGKCHSSHNSTLACWKNCVVSWGAIQQEWKERGGWATKISYGASRMLRKSTDIRIQQVCVKWRETRQWHLLTRLSIFAFSGDFQKFLEKYWYQNVQKTDYYSHKIGIMSVLKHLFILQRTKQWSIRDPSEISTKRETRKLLKSERSVENSTSITNWANYRKNKLCTNSNRLLQPTRDFQAVFAKELEKSRVVEGEDFVEFQTKTFWHFSIFPSFTFSKTLCFAAHEPTVEAFRRTEPDLGLKGKRWKVQPFGEGVHDLKNGKMIVIDNKI